MKTKFGRFKRLTARMNDGTAFVVSETGKEGVGYFTTQRRLPELISRLAAYEDTGLTPEEIIELRKHKHGLTHTRLYSIWRSMRQRCFSTQNKDFKNYGARGITICREWDNFLNFYNWAIANGYSDNLSIDRIDVNGNYCPKNCRWTNNSVQSKNRRFTQISFNGETHTIEEWSKIIGISNSGIRYRIQQNFPIEQILSPKKERR
jgi:hypothetical protein